VELGGEHKAARPAHPDQLADRSVAIDEHGHRFRHDPIEASVLVLQGADVSRLHRHPSSEPGGIDVREGPIAHVGRDVGRRDRYPKATCHLDRRGRGTTADVQNLLAGRHLGEPKQLLCCFAPTRVDYLLAQESEE
jgi:hypothetical protein